MKFKFKMKKLVLIFIGVCSFFVSCYNDQSLTQLMPDSSFIIENETAYSDIFKRAKKLSQEAKEVIESESSKANKSSERVKNHLSNSLSRTYSPNIDAQKYFNGLLHNKFEIGSAKNALNELIFTNKIINAYEKKILTEIVTTVESKDIHKLASIIYILKANNTLYSNEFDNLSKSRLISIVATLEANIEVYFGSVEFLSRKTSPQLETRGKCAESIGQGAIVGGLVGGLTGLYSGCKTGIVLGFNPGSAAAGCMGGLIVGTIGGMIGGAIEGAIQCALF